MIERQIDSPMPMPLDLVVKKALNSRSASSAADPDTAVLHRHQHLVVLVLVRSDHQFARPLRDRLHRFNAIDHEIDDHLLQLDPIAQDQRQALARAPSAATPGGCSSSRCTKATTSLTTSLMSSGTF